MKINIILSKSLRFYQNINKLTAAQNI